jgi:hypothetical protein
MTRLDLWNTWDETVIFAVVLTVLFVMPCLPALRTCFSDIQEQGLRIGASMTVWRLRWFAVGALLCFAVSHLFNVGSRRTFDAVTVTDTNVLIDYAWPRRDIAIPWNEVQDARVDGKKGRRGGRVNRLRIETLQGRHVTSWMTGRKNLQAKELIEAQTSRNRTRQKLDTTPSEPSLP